MLIFSVLLANFVHLLLVKCVKVNECAQPCLIYIFLFESLCILSSKNQCALSQRVSLQVSNGRTNCEKDKMSPGGPHAATSQLRAYLAFRTPPSTSRQPHPEKGVLTFTGRRTEEKDSQTGFSQAGGRFHGP